VYVDVAIMSADVTAIRQGGQWASERQRGSVPTEQFRSAHTAWRGGTQEADGRLTSSPRYIFVTGPIPSMMRVSLTELYQLPGPCQTPYRGSNAHSGESTSTPMEESGGARAIYS
jgi:hypothetical protein